MDEDTEGMQFDVSSSESDVDHDESRGSFPRARIHVEQCTTGEKNVHCGKRSSSK